MPQNSVTDPITDQEPTVKERFIDNQAEALRSPGRNQILARLWELANLSPEVTKNSIAGQVKAMAMIAAIEGLLPGRRVSSAPAEPPATTVPQRRLRQFLLPTPTGQAGFPMPTIRRLTPTSDQPARKGNPLHPPTDALAEAADVSGWLTQAKLGWGTS